jgi:hypothetical protein
MMAASRRAQKSKAGAPSAREHDDTAAVTAYLSALEHPLKAVVEEIRSAILAADPAITEGIKWSSASFYCHGWFATANVRAKGAVQVVLHHGAKVRDGAALGQSMEDPARLLTWLSADRAVVAFTSGDDFQGKRAAFLEVIRQWAAYQARLAEPT